MPYDTSSVVHSRSSSRTTPAALSARLFRNVHHDSLRLTQLAVVWNLSLHSDPGGPTSISNTALLSSDSGLYIRTSQSHSGHTMAAAEQHHVVQGRRTAVSPVFDVMHV